MRYWTGPGRNVDRLLREGDEVAGFKVLNAPGHSPGHVAYWRESDRVLILGDVLNNVNVTTGIPGLNDPKPYLTADPSRTAARRSGWHPSSRSSSCSGTAGRCATRGSSSTS